MLYFAMAWHCRSWCVRVQWLAAIKDAVSPKLWDWLQTLSSDFPANCNVSKLSSSPDWTTASKEAFKWLKETKTSFHSHIYILLYFVWNLAVTNWHHCNDSVNWIMWFIGWSICAGTYIEHELDVFLQIRNESRLMITLHLPLIVLLCAFSDPPILTKR